MIATAGADRLQREWAGFRKTDGRAAACMTVSQYHSLRPEDGVEVAKKGARHRLDKFRCGPHNH